MQFTDIFIRRPVFASVLSLIILLTGIRAFSELQVRQFPQITASVITISTVYSGAAAKVMEGFISTPIENALSGIEGIDRVESKSSTGASSVEVHFDLGYDINKAMTNVSNAVSSVRYVLPKDVQDPVIAANDPNASPVIYMPFASDSLSPEQLTDYLVRAVQPQLATLPGVASAPIFGQRLYAMRIWLNPKEMAARNVTAEDVINTLTQNNVQTAAGHIDSRWQEFDVTAQTDLSTPEQFNQLSIKNDNGKIIRLKDIGYAVLGPEDDNVSVFINNKSATVVAIIPQATANPLDVSEEIQRKMPQITQFLPAGMKTSVIYDSSKFISQSIHEVYRTIVEASFFVIVVIFLFLGSFRNAVIPIVTIPLSLVGVCSIMLMLGYSINTLTLLAFVMAIGLVVDDAIVVVENIHRHIEHGLMPVEAAIKGAREIGFAVIAMTMTLAAVYAPIGFVSGLTGALFREFSFTLAGAVIISGFIALTLSPMMCAKLLVSSTSTKAGFSEKIDRLFHRLMKKYQQILVFALNKKIWLIGMAVIIYAAAFLLYKTLPSELAPEEDQGVLMAVVNGPSNANLDFTTAQTQKIEKIYQHLPEQAGYGVINGYGGTGVNAAFSFLVLKPWEKRTRSVSQIIGALLPQFGAIAGVKAFPFNVPSLPGSSDYTPVDFVLKTTGSYEELNLAAQKLIAVSQRENPLLLNIDSALKMDKAQVDINFNRNKSIDLGIPMHSINTTLNVALAEPQISRFNMNGRSYNVIPQILPEFRTTPHQLGELNLRTFNGALIPLSSIATIFMQIQPQTLTHFQQLRSTKIKASLAPGYSLGEALIYLEKTAKNNLPDNIQYDFSGQSRQFIEASGAMTETFLFAIIFIFLALAAQFESFRDPLIVMASVPLSTAGALLALHGLKTGSMNIYTQIGLVTLIGLISKHGILIVEFANHLQQEGKNKFEAIIESASIRLRPVLMTTFAMILGALPLAFASGAGSGARSQLGWVIVGGMSFGTLLTLFIVPAAYLYLASVKKHERV